jgi:MoxR-like ATPase
VQFTPDLMPGDVTGSLVYDNATAAFSFREGPVFTNLLLADEINRTPPKTQASLLEAMEERQVASTGTPRPLPDPFLVAATQNPVEYEGTYPLPEAQLDRFLLKLTRAAARARRRDRRCCPARAGFDPRDLPPRTAAGRRTRRPRPPRGRPSRGRGPPPRCSPTSSTSCRATRSSPSLSLGVSPRGATALLRRPRGVGVAVRPRLRHPDDVKALARPTLRHRSAAARGRARGRHRRRVLDGVLASVPVPR